MIITLWPLDRQASFTRSKPNFSFEDVPNGQYALSVSCSQYLLYSDDNDDGSDGVPVVVSGADVFVDIHLPFPLLPQHSPTITFTGHTGQVRSVAFSADGNALVSAALDGKLVRWDSTTGEQLQTWRHEHADGRYEGTGLGLELLLSPDGTILASEQANGTLNLWDVEQGELFSELVDLDGQMTSLTFSSDSAMLAMAVRDPSDNVQIVLWDVATGERLRALDLDQYQRLCEKCLHFSQDGTTLISVVDEAWPERGNIVWWDIATGDRLRSISFQDLEIGWPYISDAAVSSDEKLFAIGISGPEGWGDLRIWNVATGRILSAGFPFFPWNLAFSPDGSTFTLSMGRDDIYLWDMSTNGARYILTSNVGRSSDAAWSPDGTMLAAGSEDGTILLWEIPIEE